jgi:hypothetical protein
MTSVSSVNRSCEWVRQIPIAKSKCKGNNN